MAAKADTLGRDLMQATCDVMAGKKDLPEVKVSTCTQYQLFSAIMLIFWMELAAVTCTVQICNKMFVIQVEIEDQLPIVGKVDEQVQDVANIGFQEGLLPEKKMAEEQWCLKDSVMTAFNTFFQDYKSINQGFMELSKLINGMPLHSMGAILNNIQESAA